MACDRKTAILISCYADGEATPEEATRAREHLEQCAHCREMVEEWSRQRVMFEWAHAVELPEETSVDWREDMVVSGRRTFTPMRAHSLRNWAFAAVLVAAVIGGVVFRYVASLPPVLKVGEAMVANDRSRVTRIGDDVRLTLGPRARVMRVNDRTIRLTQGWVSASVSSGPGLRIFSPRMNVVDRGTHFKVGTSSKLDYVTVDEGWVAVSTRNRDLQVQADQGLIVQDGKQPWLTQLPEDKQEQIGSFRLLSQGLKSGFELPATDMELDMDEGLRRLATEFPRVRWQPRGFGCDQKSDGIQFWESIGLVIGLDTGLREHFADIAQVVEYDTVDSRGWEIPVAIMHLSGLDAPVRLPADVYYLRIVPKDGKIVWRLTGSKGGQADLPFVTSKREESPELIAQSGYSNTIIRPGGITIHKCVQTVWLADWPGLMKPTLTLELASIPQPKDVYRMLREAKRRVPAIRNLDLDDVSPTVLYLDRARKYRFLVAWNKNAGKDLCRVSDLENLGRSGYAILGVVVTDMPLEEPRVGRGVYLLRFVLEGAGQAPRLEITAPDVSGAPSHILGTIKPRPDSGSGFGWSPESLPGYGTVQLNLGRKAAGRDSFAFTFQVVGRPDDRSTRRVVTRHKGGYSVSQPTPTGVWAEGLIRVRKP